MTKTELLDQYFELIGVKESIAYMFDRVRTGLTDMFEGKLRGKDMEDFKVGMAKTFETALPRILERMRAKYADISDEDLVALIDIHGSPLMKKMKERSDILRPEFEAISSSELDAAMKIHMKA